MLNNKDLHADNANHENGNESEAKDGKRFLLKLI